MATKKRVGFIGVGLMGHGMAKNILEKGYALTVLGHRNRTPVESLVKHGAKEAKSAAELARDSDILFICVTGSPQVEEAIYKADGVLAGAHQGLIVVDTSTSEPESTLKIGADLAELLGGQHVERRPQRKKPCDLAESGFHPSKLQPASRPVRIRATAA